MNNFLDKNTLTLFNAISKSTDDYVYVADLNSNKIIWSDSACKDLGLPQSCSLDEIRKILITMIHPEDVKRLNDDKIDILNTNIKAYKYEYRLKNVNNLYVWVQCRGIIEEVSSINDNYNIYIGIIKNLGDTVRIDQATGLKSISEFKQFFTERLKNNSINGAVLNVSISDIRKLNTKYSYNYVDNILSELAEEMKLTCPPNSKVFRVHGNHFVMHIEDCSECEIVDLYKRIRINFFKRLNRTNIFSNTNLNLFGAVVMLNKLSNLTFERLSQMMNYTSNLAANKKIYTTPVFFSESRYLNELSKLNLLDELLYCIKNNIGSFKLYYQPIVNPNTNMLCSAEALLRWDNPLFEKFGTEEIVKVLENSGLIVPLGNYIIKTALEELKRWQEYIPKMHVNINIAIPQISDFGLPLYIADVIMSNKLKAEDIVFEITETYQINDYDEVRNFINAIHKIGSEIALDDFGTGNASLNALKAFDVDWIKVDQDFVLKISQNTIDQNILKHISELCHSMNIKVCVEGVGSQDSLDVVQQFFPETVQGFHFSTPLPQEEFFENYIRNYNK